MEKKSFGDYTILKQIGVGCLGKVFLAEHRFIKKNFAIKVLPQELSSDRSFTLRFEKEIASLANLDHPHIVKVHNVSFSDGFYFLVMDCIVDSYGETTNLEQYLAIHQCKMQESEFVSILSQVASALDYAHQKKSGDQFFIHRGLKLNNILIGKKESGFQVFLSDFGLSKIIGEGALLSKTFKMLTDILCIDSTLIDTYSSAMDKGKLSKLHASFLQHFEFLSPEQKDINYKLPLTPRSDTYSFGVLAYYLLMHRYPYGVFPMPSSHPSRYKLDWDNLITKCLQENPNNRPLILSELMSKLKVSAYDQKPAAAEETKSTSSYSLQERSEFSSSSAMLEPSETLSQPMKLKQLRVEEMAKNSELTQVAVIENVHQESHSDIENKKFEAYKKMEEPKPVLSPGVIKRPTYEEDPSSIFHLETTVARYIPKKKEVYDIEPIQTEMVVIPGGEYVRGTDECGRDERPKHAIRLSSFAMDIHPITNEQFVRFLEAMGGEKDANNNDIIRLRESRIKRTAGKLIIESGYAKHPVVGVTWYGAIAYAKWVGKKLPTEAQWEIAARSGLSDIIYPTGDDIERTQANFFSSDTVSVMSYPPNQFGLYDVAGNVYEWCQDWYDYTYYEVSAQEPDDPEGPHQGVYRVLRGGCWKSLKDDLRCSNRHRNNPGTVNRTYGFRCAADVK